MAVEDLQRKNDVLTQQVTQLMEAGNMIRRDLVFDFNAGRNHEVMRRLTAAMENARRKP